MNVSVCIPMILLIKTLAVINVFRNVMPEEKEIHKIGNVKLYLMEEIEDSDNFHDKILFLRDGMMIKTFPKGVGGLPKRVCGVMFCEDNIGNAILGAMEPHAHDDFIAALLEDKTVIDKDGKYPLVSDGNKIISQIKSFITDSVKKIKDNYVTDVTEVPFIDELFNGVIDGADSSGGVGKTTISESESFNRKIKKQDIKVSFFSDKKNTIVHEDDPIDIGDNDGGSGGGDGGNGNGGNDGKGNKPDKGKGGGKSINRKVVKSISSRAFYKSNSGDINTYCMILRSNTDLSDFDIEIVQNNDSGSNLNLEGKLISAKIDNKDLNIDGNKIKGLSASEGEPCNITIEIQENFKSALTLKVSK